MQPDGAPMGLTAATSTRSTLDRGHVFWAQTTRHIMVRAGMLRMAKQSVLHTWSAFSNSLFDTLHKFCNNNSRLDRLPPFLTYRSPPGIPARASPFSGQLPDRDSWRPASCPRFVSRLVHPRLSAGFRTLCTTKITRDIARPGQFAILACRGQRTAIRTWSLGQRGANSETDPTRVGFCFTGRVSPRQSAISDQSAIESGGEENHVQRDVQADHQHH
jgi:hypothetical protein